MKKRLTLADVAIAAGVSKMTASRALRGARDVSQENVEKVRQAARDIGYVGNHVATSLSSQRSNLIGAVVPSTTNIVFAEVLSGIAEAISGTGLQPVFGVTDYDAEREYETLRGMLSWRPAGLIVTGLDQQEDTRRLLEAADLPIVQIMDTDGVPVDGCVGISQREAGAAMARALTAAGRQRIGYIGCAIDQDTRARKRRESFDAALRQAGLTLIGSVVSDQHSSVEAGRELTRQFLDAGHSVDCLYFSNDDLAVGGLFHCIDRGISVPEHLLLAGFNGLDLVRALPGRIATTFTPRHEIGLRAAELILNAIAAGQHQTRETIELPTRVDIGTVSKAF